MTHTLHREGTIESLQKDFVVLAMATQGVNVKDSAPRLKRFLEIAKQYNPVNGGATPHGALCGHKDYESLIDKVVDGNVVHAVFDDPEALAGFLKQLKEEQLGMSIVVSGLMDSVGECCEKAGLKPHTQNMSLGIYGKKEKLAPDNLREVTTMCGHGMVTADLVLRYVEQIKKGVITPEEASKKMGSMCICGIFNTRRSADLLKRMAAV